MRYGFLPYLALGLLMTKYKLERRGTDRLIGVWLAVFVACLVLVPTLDDIGFPKVFTAIVICLSLIGIMVWVTTRLPTTTRGLAFLGTYSMIIFLSHMIFSAGMRAALITIGVEDIALHMGLATFAGVVLPIVFQQTFSRVGSPKLLGA